MASCTGAGTAAVAVAGVGPVSAVGNLGAGR